MGNLCTAPISETNKKAKFSAATLENLLNTYNLDPRARVVGSGSNGKIYLATNKKDETLKVAIKVV